MSRLQRMSQRTNFMIMRLESARVAIEDAWNLSRELKPYKLAKPFKDLTAGISSMKRMLKRNYLEFKRRTSGQK